MADVYRVGVAIGMTDNATQVIQTLARNILGLNSSVLDVERNMGRLKFAAIGLAGVLGGEALAKGMNSLATAGGRVLDQQTQMKNAGMTNLQIIQETAQVYKSMSEVRGLDVAQRLQAVRELRGIAGEGHKRSLAEANQLLPDYLRAQTIVGAQQAHTLFRAIELRGDVQFDHKGNLNNQLFHTGLDRALRAIQASGGTVTPRDLYGVMQQAGPMARMMAPEAFYGMMTTAIMEMGGQRAGTALTAIGRALYGGIMPERNANEMLNLGLYDPRAVRHVRGLSRAQKADLKSMGYSVGRGGAVMVDRNALIGQEVRDRLGVGAWMNQFLAPRLHAAFLRQHGAHPHLTEQQYDMQEMYRLLPTEPSRRFTGFYLTQRENIERDQKLQDQSLGMGAYDNNQNNYTTQLHNLQQSWSGLMQTLGLPAARDGASILKGLGVGIDSLTRAASAHPDAAKNLVRLTAGVAGLTALSGAIAITAVALGPLNSGLRVLFATLSKTSAAAVASGAAPAATASIASRASTLFGRVLGGAGLAYEGYSLYEDQKARDNHLREMLRNRPREAQQAQWLYDHSYGMFGLNMKPGQAQPIQVTTQVVLDRRVLAEAVTMHAQEQARQDMRASGTAPDLMRHTQYPGRSVGQ